MKTKYAKAELCDILALNAAESLVSVEAESELTSSPAYITDNVLTTNSLAPIPERIPTLIFQSKCIGDMTGAIRCPIRCKYEGSVCAS